MSGWARPTLPPARPRFQCTGARPARIVRSASSGARPVAYAPAMADDERRPDIDPSPAALQRFLEDDDGRPVTMLNLLRFRPGGRARYDEYLTRLTPLLRSLGGEVVYAGEMSAPFIPAEGSGWDAILLTRWPQRRLVLELVAHPDYPALRRLRQEALAATVFETTVAW